MPVEPDRRIVRLVRSAGSTRSPLSWTPPHTLGGASAPPFFFLIRVYYQLFLPDDFINYEPPPAIVGLGGRLTAASEIRQCAQTTDKSSGAGTVLLGIVAIALAGMAGTIGLIHQVGEFGPKVGDIVSFDPLDPMSRDMHARVCPPCRSMTKPGVACVLDVRDHARQRRQPDHRGARPRSPASATGCTGLARTAATDGADCGASADLLVNLEDIELLAMAAGGYGVPAKQACRPRFWRSAARRTVTIACRRCAAGDIDGAEEVSAT